jgi:uncharacterized protein (DUF2267 family)
MKREDFAATISRRLRCDPERAGAIARAVLATVRDGLGDAEARQVVAHLPAAIAAMMPERTGARPEMPETGGRGFLALVRARAELASDRGAARAVHEVFGAMMKTSGVDGPGGAWNGLRHLPPELKSIWMRIFRAAAFPVERLVQRP